MNSKNAILKLEFKIWTDTHAVQRGKDVLDATLFDGSRVKICNHGMSFLMSVNTNKTI